MNPHSNMRTTLAPFCLAITLTVPVMPAAEPTWPEFHGPGRANISGEQHLLKRWPEGGPPLIWTFPHCGRGYSGVTIAGGMIFTAGDFDDAERLIALDMGGRRVWEAPNGRPWRGACPGSRATPTWSDNVLYHMNPNGRLAAFDALTGREIWTVDLVERFGASFGIWGLAENVVADGDRVFCMPGGPGGRIVALDKRTGETIWCNTEIGDSAAYCSPAIVTHNGVRQLVTMTQKSVLGIALDDGRLVWSAPFVPRSPQNALTPVYHDGRVFVACGHSSGGTVFQIDDAACTATPIWSREDLDNCHGGAVLIQGRLFGSGCRQGGKKFYCVDFLSGRTIQLDDTLGKVGITCADGMLYCLNHQGTMSLVAITPAGFEIASQFDLGKRPANSYLAHPVVCGGRLYIRCNQELRAFDIRAR
ncbi:MAG TPA: PQQ-binding-like beta-propeller repeat protein [Verrucomicrobiae bacterium]|nr:PQQ-binding-like beta-propeller repeat protein [Verrucomicrobiae bacterium]